VSYEKEFQEGADILAPKRFHFSLELFHLEKWKYETGKVICGKGLIGKTED
jgi:hypothetical protein